MKIVVKTYKEPLVIDGYEGEAEVEFYEPTPEMLFLAVKSRKGDSAAGEQIAHHVSKQLKAIHGVELEKDGKSYQPDISDFTNLPTVLMQSIISSYVALAFRLLTGDNETPEKNE